MHDFERTSFARSVFTAPWLWVTALTVGFYQSLPHIPVGQEMLQRYFCSHPLEYVLAGLFFLGLSIILVKAFLLKFETGAFRSLPDFGEMPEESTFADNIQRLETRVGEQFDRLINTYWGRRLGHLLAFFRSRNSSDGASDHLTYLSDSSHERLQSSHALLQTVIWAIPIIGFLGTVMGITLAIANVTPDQLDSSLDDVTGGLAVAFDTTALALSLSLILGFASLFVKRSEEQLLSAIDERTRLEVHRCFPSTSGAMTHPLLEAESMAAETLIAQTNELIKHQAAVWNDAVDSIREQWSETLDDQRQHLVNTMQSGTESTLGDHAEQLAEFRKQLVESQVEISERFTAEMVKIEARREIAEERLIEQLTAVTKDVQTSAQQHSEHQLNSVNQLLEQFANRVDGWQQTTSAWQIQLADVNSSIENQTAHLHKQTDALKGVVGQEESLLRLQSSLNDNLESIRTADAFEETLHNLTAAVHLLTARAGRRDAA